MSSWIWLPIVGILVLLWAVIQFGTVLPGRKRKKKQAALRPERVHEPRHTLGPGNAGVFQHLNGDIHVIPFSMDLYREGRACGIPVLLPAPVQEERLGEVVRLALELSGKGQPIPVKDLMDALGFRVWADFTQGRRSASLNVKQGKGVQLSATTRVADGTYFFNRPQADRTLSLPISDRVLGTSILETLRQSR